MKVRFCSQCGLKHKGRVLRLETSRDVILAVRCPRCGHLEELDDDEA